MKLGNILLFFTLVNYVFASHFACVLFRQLTPFTIQSKGYIQASGGHPTEWSAGWDVHPALSNHFTTKFQGNRFETGSSMTGFEFTHKTGFWGSHTNVKKVELGNGYRTYLYQCVDSDNIGYCSSDKVSGYANTCMDKI